MAIAAEADLVRAKGLRAQAKTVKDPVAKSAFEAAADRMERRAAKKARKLARPKRRVPGFGGF